MTRSRGEGSLYLRGTTWWVAYHVHGRLVRESAKTVKQSEAVKYLRRRLGEVGVGKYVGLDAERVTFEDLMALVRTDYTNKGRRSLPRVENAITRLAESFAGERAMRIKAGQLSDYLDARVAGGAALATACYELAMLRRGFRLAVKRELLPARPEFPVLTVENNVRQGFFEEGEFRALCEALPAHLIPVAQFAFLTGWRREEIIGLTWDRVDFPAGVIRLDVGTTKNGDGRTFPMDALPALVALLKCQRTYTEVQETVEGRAIPWVFHRAGRPLKDYYGAWRSACRRAGLTGKIFHDFRRTAVRNLERASVARSVATKLTGHKTESVYRRYAIVNEADLRAGVEKLAKALSRSGK